MLLAFEQLNGVCYFASVSCCLLQGKMCQLLRMQQPALATEAAAAPAARPTDGYNRTHPEAAAAVAAETAAVVRCGVGVAAGEEPAAEAGAGQQVMPAGMMSSVTITAHLSRVLQSIQTAGSRAATTAV
jgi:hypothetical protein